MRLISRTVVETREHVLAGNMMLTDRTEELLARQSQIVELLASLTSQKAVVLLYHKVAEPAADPFKLAVSQEQFREHIEALSAFGHFLPLAELARRVDAGTLTEICFAVTFDDGYADNLHAAKPILERYGVPATVFAVSAYLDGAPFWWDELAQLVLGNGVRAEQIELEVEGVTRRWRLEDSGRERVYHEIWRLLQEKLDDRDRHRALASIRAQLRSEAVMRSERSLNAEELRELAVDGLVDVGAHTKTHPVLRRLGHEEALEEIRGSKTLIEAILERPITAFAYPYGVYGGREVNIVRDAGFEIACAAMSGVVTASCDRLQLPRLEVGHRSGAELERTLALLLGSSRGMTVSGPSFGRVQSVELGDLRRLEPFSRNYGADRGNPVDRRYIERFLGDRPTAIHGRVLEIGEPLYTTLFGGDRVSHSDVLDTMGSPAATYTCRLEEGDELPTDGFDCIVCTQTLQYVYDLRAAIRTLHRILKPEGNLLVTVPGISPEHPEPWPLYWSFTASSIAALCAEFFDRDAVEVEVFGNVLAASAFLYGLADAELADDELDHVDPAYAVTIGVSAVK